MSSLSTLDCAMDLRLTHGQVSRDLQPGGPAGVVIDLLTLQFLPYELRGLIVGGIGIALLVLGSVRVIRAFMDPFRSDDGAQPLIEVIYQKRFLARGPKIVAIGGGTGLSALLRGLKEHSSNLTAVVTVADDGAHDIDAHPVQLGVGLENVRRRLDALYGAQGRLVCAPGERRGFAAVLELPLERR